MVLNSLLRCVAVSVAACFGSSALCQVWFSGIGDIPGGAHSSEATRVSGDGVTAVGWGTPEVGTREAIRWTAHDGLVVIGDFDGGIVFSDAFDASFNGQVIVGRGTNAGGNSRAFRWTSEDGLVSLGVLPGHINSLAWGVSGDGSLVAGFSTDASVTEAFRWTAHEGMVGLGNLGGSKKYSVAFGVSGDGSTIVGRSNGPFGEEAFRWTEATGMVGLGDLPGGGFKGTAFDASTDGSIIVGWSLSGALGGDEAFIWTMDGGMQGLGTLPGFAFSFAHGVSGDGSTVVGFCRLGSSEYAAFIWTAADGMRDLAEVLTNEYGLDLGGWSISRAMSISDDGRTIVGFGINPAGQQEGWVVTIPSPGTGAAMLVFGLWAWSRPQRRNADEAR